MMKDQQNTSNNTNDECSYSEDIIDQYVLELPKFDKKLIPAPNQQRRKKVLKPIRTHTLSATRRRQCSTNTPYQTTYTSRTGAHSYTSNVNNLLSKDQIFRIKQLENELVEARMKIKDFIAENRLLKTIEKRHENALLMYEGKKAKLPQMMKSYEEDIRTLQSQLRQIKISYKEMEKRYKSQSTELMILQKQHSHLLSLSKNKELNKREKLSAQLEEAQDIIKQQDKKLQNLTKQLELQNKTHRTHINSENNKIKQLQYEKEQLKNKNNNLKLNLDKLKTNRYRVRKIFGQGITENSISITNRLKLEPTIQGQGDETDEFVYKINDSISLKSESLQEENCMDPIKFKKKCEPTKTHNQNPKTKNNESNNILWLNENQTKLKKKNIPELPSIENNNNFENQNESKFKTSHTIRESPMSRIQKDLLLAKLNQVADNDNDYENSYSLKSTNHRYSSLDSNDVSSKSSFSD